jgi:hypothetical protein
MLKQERLKMNSLSLYQLTHDHQSLLSQLYDYETGEVNKEIEEKLNASSHSIEKKCISVASYIQHLESERAQLDHIKKQIKEREAAYDDKIEGLEKYLKSNMEYHGIEKVECPYFTIRIKNNPYSTEILDESLIPKDYINYKVIEKVETKPDKNAIKEQVLKTGQQIPGAYVSKKTQLKIEIGRI